MNYTVKQNLLAAMVVAGCLCLMGAYGGSAGTVQPDPTGTTAAADSEWHTAVTVGGRLYAMIDITGRQPTTTLGQLEHTADGRFRWRTVVFDAAGLDDTGTDEPREPPEDPDDPEPTDGKAALKEVKDALTSDAWMNTSIAVKFHVQNFPDGVSNFPDVLSFHDEFLRLFDLAAKPHGPAWIPFRDYLVLDSIDDIEEYAAHIKQAGDLF